MWALLSPGGGMDPCKHAILQFGRPLNFTPFQNRVGQTNDKKKYFKNEVEWVNSSKLVKIAVSSCHFEDRKNKGSSNVQQNL